MCRGGIEPCGNLRPPRELTNAREIRIVGDVRLPPEAHNPLQHHERVVRAAAERLGTRQEEHQVRVVPTPLLDGPPGQIVKGLVVAASSSSFSLGAAVRCIGAGRPGRGLEQKNEGKKKRHLEP